MKRLFLFLTLLSLPLHAQQAAPDPAIAKLRESLKSTMLQLRTEQTEKAALQAKADELEAKNKELSEQLTSLNKKSDAARATSEKTIADLNNRFLSQEKETARLDESLKKWKLGYAQKDELSKKKESDRAQLASEKIVLERKVADREIKNLELYKTGVEILNRYENFGLGRALLAREPFTGIAKIKLENAVQDYRDKLQDQKIKPEPAPKP